MSDTRMHCAGKRGYDTRSEAAAQVAGVRRRTKTNEKINLYKCSECGLWHFGGAIEKGKPKRRWDRTYK